MAIRFKPFLFYTTALSALTLSFLTVPAFIGLFSTAWAANECGAAVAGATVTCNNDGSPASDTSPYAAISYTVPVHLTVDGTVNPISSSGVINVSGNGDRSITLLGSVSIISPNISGALVGSNTPASLLAKNNSVSLGENVSFNVSRTNAAGTLIGVWSRSRNGMNIVNSQADIVINQTGSGGAPYIGGVIIEDNVGGTDASAVLTLGGTLDLTSSGNGSLIGSVIFMLADGSSAPALLDSSAAITLRNNTGNAGCYGLSVQNAGSGGAIVNHTGSLSIQGTCGAAGTGIHSQARNGGNAFITVDGTVDLDVQSPLATGISFNVLDGGSSLSNINNNISVTSTQAANGIYIFNAHDYIINIADNVLISATGGTGAYAINGLLGNNGTINIGQGSHLSSSLGTAIATGVGADQIISSGNITGSISTGDGNDSVLLSDGSVIGGVEMGADDDTLEINSNNLDMSQITHLDGGAGEDALTFSNIHYSGGSLASNDLALGINLGQDWETINFNNAEWTLTGNLTLGGSTVNIDASSVLLAGNGVNPVIASVIPGDPATVNNAGTIDLTNGTSGTTDTLTIRGHYVGQNGDVLMNVDAVTMSSDRIIVDGANGGGSITGTTLLTLMPNGLGAPTSGNGILLVETINGATTATNAFTLSSAVSGGAYSYNLSNAPNQNWYLVSAGLRPEVALDMSVPALTHQLGMGMLGTMHERVYTDSADETPGQARKHAIWTRAFGETGRIGNSADPGYDWNMAGVQAGADLYRDPAYQGRRNIAGFYVGAGRVDADVSGNVGSADASSYSAGVYWTHHAPDNKWYTDAVLQGTMFDSIKTASVNGEALETEGKGIAASLEAGRAIYADDDFSITPQIQFVYQANDIDSGADAVGRIAYDTADAVYGRFGMNYANAWHTEQGKISGWLRPNIWHNFNAGSTTTFSNLAGANAVAQKNSIGNSWGQIGTGMAAEIGPMTTIYASADYNIGLDHSGSSLAGKLGLKIMW